MRLIDADALFKALGFAELCSECDHALGCFCVDPTWNDVCGAIGEAPTIDAVPVVRCGDCKHYENYAEHECDINGAMSSDVGYCSYGERKENDETD